MVNYPFLSLHRSDVSLTSSCRGAAHGERGDLRLAQADGRSAGKAAAALRQRWGVP